MDQVFIANFVDTCIDQGSVAPDQMIEKAKNKISELDIEIKKLEELRLLQYNYRDVIRHLGGALESPKTKRKKALKMDVKTTITELDDYLKDFCILICDKIEGAENPISMRDMGDLIAPREEYAGVLAAIKWLFGQGIISRQETSPNRELIQGVNWDKRPKSNEEITS